MKLTQINLNGSKAAQSLLYRMAAEWNIDVIMATERNKAHVRTSGRKTVSEDGTAAIGMYNPQLKTGVLVTGKGFVKVRI